MITSIHHSSILCCSNCISATDGLPQIVGIATTFPNSRIGNVD
jgi:hypothetical protein